MDDRSSASTFGALIDSGVLSVTDGYRAKNSELGGDGPLFLRAGHVTDTHIDFEGVDRFDNALAPKLADKTSRPGDVAERGAIPHAAKSLSVARLGCLSHEPESAIRHLFDADTPFPRPAEGGQEIVRPLPVSDVSG
jgi:hypothetical protein